MWRWSYSCSGWHPGTGVFSTYVEVILNQLKGRQTVDGILHVCGGDPTKIIFFDTNYDTQKSHPRNLIPRVFSTYVEVILDVAVSFTRTCCILHVCGGDPTNQHHYHFASGYSPRMWRWSQYKRIANGKQAVFSTYVEVIPPLVALSKHGMGILHVCGGDPYYDAIKSLQEQYSPRMWRWS